MGHCTRCGRAGPEIAEVLSLCADCIRAADEALLAEIDAVHSEHRRQFDLPGSPPRAAAGLECGICANRCRMAEGERGYCGVRVNRSGTLRGGDGKGAAVSWYHDGLPTNCVADWVCPGGTGAGYPRWAYRNGPERGYTNLAVFYEACSFDCLFCQNWHYRERFMSHELRSSEELAEAVDASTACICFFGGDPTCQLPHALTAARLARKRTSDRILRICWETNGSMNSALLEEMVELSWESGGCVKFDLKAFDRRLHRALCGTDNRRTLDNFALAAGRTRDRPEPPPLVASTLLVPGYVDAEEVRQIAAFVAGLDPGIPYSLLGFHGDFLMGDLPPTSWGQAERCLEAARGAGLKRVRVGNVGVLGWGP